MCLPMPPSWLEVSKNSVFITHLLVVFCGSSPGKLIHVTSVMLHSLAPQSLTTIPPGPQVMELPQALSQMSSFLTLISP